MQLELTPHSPKEAEELENLEIPWDLSLADMPRQLFAPGESQRAIQHPQLRGYGLELPSEQGLGCFRALQTLAQYGLPVARPLALAHRRSNQADLLLLQLPDQTLPLQEALLVEPAEKLATGIAKLLVHLHLAGFTGKAEGHWSFAYANKDHADQMFLLAAPAKLQPDLDEGQRHADLEAVGRSLREVAISAAFTSITARSLSDQVEREYESLWDLAAKVRLFVEDGAQLQTRLDQNLSSAHKVAPLSDGGLHLSCALAPNPEPHGFVLNLLTGLMASETAAKQVLQDIARFHAWLEFASGHPWPRAIAANRWVTECFLPTIHLLPSFGANSASTPSHISFA